MKMRKRTWVSVLARCIGATTVAAGGLLLGVQPASATNSPAACDGTANDPDTCTARTTGNGQVCMGDLSGFGSAINCTANDVSIGYADNVRDPVTGDSINSCVQNSTLNATADFHVQTSGGVTRYDIGLFFATDGDPNHDGAKSGVCEVSKISGPSPTNNVFGNFLQLDPSPDTCGDINVTHKPQTIKIAFSTLCTPSPLFFNPATGQCQATDAGAGNCVLLPNGVSWRQTGANEVCDSAIDAFPGTTSKCNVNPTFGIPVRVESANVGVQKTANPDSIQEPGGTVTYTVKVTNNASFSNLTITTIQDNVYGDVANASKPNVSNNTCPNLVGNVLSPGGFATCSFDTSVSGNAGGSIKDIVEVCGNSSSEGSGCGHDDATVTITDVATEPSVTKEVTSWSMNVTYTVQVTNNSSFDTLTVDSLSDNRFGDITTAHAAGGGSEQVVSTTCDTVVGTTLGVSSNKSCTFVGRITNTSTNPHVNTVTSHTTDDDGVTFTDSDNASVTVNVQ